MAFKLYGYSQSDDGELLELREATVCVGPAEARALSKFFARCAQEMESTPDWDHVHFSGGSVPDLIVAKLSK
jgi:hypothetical protein